MNDRRVRIHFIVTLSDPAPGRDEDGKEMTREEHLAFLASDAISTWEYNAAIEDGVEWAVDAPPK